MQQEALLRKARTGDADAFAELCTPFSGMVYRHCLQMMKNPADAEDAAQETMLRAYRAMPRFLGRSNVATWLYRIAHNTCLDVLKRPARQREATSVEALGEAGYDPPSETQTPEEAYLADADAKRLQEAIGKLPQDQQVLLSLRYSENLSYEELSRRTGIREGTVKSKLNRAKARLQTLLQP